MEVYYTFIHHTENSSNEYTVCYFSYGFHIYSSKDFCEQGHENV